jgi:hypothetical protein
LSSSPISSVCRVSFRFFCKVLLTAALAATAHPQQTGPSGALAITLVTVASKNSSAPPIEIPKEDVLVYEAMVRKRVYAWIPARGDHGVLQLAIVIDDQDRHKIDAQLDKLRDFVSTQPASTSIGVYYLSSGTVNAAAQISADHDAAAKALRAPRGSLGNLASPYPPLLDLITNWPPTPARREIAFVSSGCDLLHPDISSPSSVQDVAEAAVQARIPIYPIQVDAVGPCGTPYPGMSDSRQFFQQTFLSIGFSNLYHLAEETGGLPPRPSIGESFAPFLEQLNTALNNQYFLVWITNPSKKKKGELRSFKVRAEEDNIQIVAPKKVFVP